GRFLGEPGGSLQDLGEIVVHALLTRHLPDTIDVPDVHWKLSGTQLLNPQGVDPPDAALLSVVVSGRTSTHRCASRQPRHTCTGTAPLADALPQCKRGNEVTWLAWFAASPGATPK